MAITRAKEARELFLVTLFATVPDLLDHLRATYDPKNGNTYDSLFEPMRNAEVLMLETLEHGVVRHGPMRSCFGLFNHRDMHRLPTVMTKNERAWPHRDRAYTISML